MESAISFPESVPAEESEVEFPESKRRSTAYFVGSVPDKSNVERTLPGAFEYVGLQTPPESPKETPKPLNLRRNQEPDIMSMLSVMMERMDKLESTRVATPSELKPSDSSSTFERYQSKQKYWKPDYNAPSQIIESPEEEAIEEITCLGVDHKRDEKNVVRGFVKDRPTAYKELRITNQIKAIPGLQCVFVNERLNFLAHLHNALHKLDRTANSYPPDHMIELLENVCNERAKTPQFQLLQMVIKTTIDFDEMRVIANHFSLPIIEVGMFLSERYIYQLFDKLNLEYESAWFDTVKDLHVPEFHKKYSNRSDAYLNVSKKPRTKHRRTSTSELTVRSDEKKRHLRRPFF